jgi:hypothetical protein
MKRNLIAMILPVLLVLLSACSPAAITSTDSAPAPSPTSPQASAAQESENALVQIDQLEVRVGVGSPIPVHALISGTLPDTCAQLSETRVQVSGATFELQLSAAPGQGAECIADPIPFRAEIPLNVIGLPEGPYQVSANGVTASFDPRQASRVPFNFAGVSLDLDPGTVDLTSGMLVPENPGSPGGPFWEAMPEHVLIALPSTQAAQTAPLNGLAVYPVEDYRRLNPQAVEILDQLEDLLAQKPADPERIPSLPVINTGQVFHTQLEYLDFRNGSGVRFLAVYSQAVDPITNRELVYVFQGLTADGRQAVAAFLPVSHPDLVDDPNALTPAELDVIYQDYGAYLEGTVAGLSEQPAGSFTPDLETLDALIASLLVVR